MSGGRWEEGAMEVSARKEEMGFAAGEGGKGEWGVWRTSGEMVRRVRQEVDRLWEEHRI